MGKNVFPGLSVLRCILTFWNDEPGQTGGNGIVEETVFQKMDLVLPNGIVGRGFPESYVFPENALPGSVQT